MLSDDIRSALLGSERFAARERKSGRIEFRCPRHDDNQPSAWLWGGAWGCFTCGFTDSIVTLAPDVGVELRQNGRPGFHVCAHAYRDAAGNPLHYRDRFEGVDGKGVRGKVLPRQPDGQRQGTPPVPYNLPEVLRAIGAGETIVFVEGEKSADVLIAHGFASTTTGSASSSLGVHAELFRGARVVIWPDADAPGEGYASRIAAELAGVAMEVRVLRFAEKPSGWDAFDFFHEGGSTEQLDTLMSDAPAFAPPGIAAEAPAGAAVGPLFRAEDVRFDRFLAAEPPVRRWLLADVLPSSVAGLLAAMGGAGKSYAIYQLAIAIATGLPFLGLEVSEPGGVLYLAAEDDEAELHRRGRMLLDHYTHDPALRRLAADRLHVLSRVAADNLLTARGADGEVRQTANLERLILAARQIPDLRLIVLDPISRFRGGAANHEEDATRYVEAQERLREETGATVLGLAHVSQSGIREGGGQEIVRGSTAMVDGVRWVATLQRLRPNDAAEWGIAEEEAARYLRLDVPKSNYAAPFPGLWLRRGAGGVLVPCELERQVDARRKERDHARYLEILAAVQALIRREGPMTERRFRDFAGLTGVLGAGDHAVRSVIERAIGEGALVKRQDGPRPVIDLSAGDA